MTIARTDNLGLVLVVLLLGMNELDKTAFSLFAGAFTNACRIMDAGACTLLFPSLSNGFTEVRIMNAHSFNVHLLN